MLSCFVLFCLILFTMIMIWGYMEGKNTEHMMSGIYCKIFYHGYNSNNNSGDDDWGRWNTTSNMFHTAKADM